MKFGGCFCLLIWSAATLSAKELTAYQAGDTADADVITPVALDVVDAAATKALQSARATQFPAVFRSLPGTTNALAHNFLTVWDQTHASFLAALTNDFHAAQPGAATIASPEFGRFVTAFTALHPEFPITDEIGGEWARGREAQDLQQTILGELLQAANQRLLPEPLPPDLALGKNIRLVPVTEPDQKLSFEAVEQAPLVPADSLVLLTNAQAAFRREFPAGQALLARALAGWIQPNCRLDAPFTQLTRGTAVYQLVVSEHFDAGDTLVRQGDKLEAKQLAALAALNEKLHSNPGLHTPVPTNAPRPTPAPASASPIPPPSRVAAGPEPAAAVAAQAAPAKPTAPAPKPLPEAKTGGAASAAAVPADNSSMPPPAPAPAPATANPLVPGGTLAAVWALTILALLWRWHRHKLKAQAAALAALAPAGATPLSAALAPQVSEVLREAVQQELGAQRRDLLLVQQAAAGEIAALVNRLDDLHLPLQERLRTYEGRIQTLEKELAVRNAENRQLLTTKIEMVNRQMEAERAAGITPPGPT